MTKLKDNGMYVVTSTGDGDGPTVLERTDEPIVLTEAHIADDLTHVHSVDGEYLYTLGTSSATIYPTWLRPDMRPWPAPKRCTRRQRRLRGALKAWRRRVGAGVPHRFGFVAVAPDGRRWVV